MAVFDAEQVAVLRDEFARDMATAQKLNGKLPTPAENHDLATPLFERIERDAETPKYEAPIKAEKRGVADKHASEMGMRIVRDDSELPSERIVRLSEVDAEIFLRMRERVNLLLTKQEPGPLGIPSWRDRVMSAVATYRHFKVRGTSRDRNPGWGELLDVLEASSAVFGRWERAPERKLYGHG